MNHLEFFPFHNHFIQFYYLGELKEGVILDDVPYSQKKTGKEYVFIPTENLKKWKKADTSNNLTLKEKLQEIIDIRKITTASRINTNYDNLSAI